MSRKPLFVRATRAELLEAKRTLEYQISFAKSARALATNGGGAVMSVTISGLGKSVTFDEGSRGRIERRMADLELQLARVKHALRSSS